MKRPFWNGGTAICLVGFICIRARSVARSSLKAGSRNEKKTTHNGSSCHCGPSFCVTKERAEKAGSCAELQSDVNALRNARLLRRR